jgi:2-enoate reductase
MRVAGVPDDKRDLANLLRWYELQLTKLGVSVETSQEVTTDEIVGHQRPDAVIIATGSKELKPDIPGIDRPNVVKATDLLEGKVAAAEKVIVAGGGLVGCETALYLAEKGHKVTCLDMQDELAMDMEVTSRAYLIKKLVENGVDWFTGATITEIRSSGIVYKDKEGRFHNLEGQTIVLALGMEREAGLEEALKGKVGQVALVGDCEPEMSETDRPGGIYRAIHSGFRVADSLSELWP